MRRIGESSSSSSSSRLKTKPAWLEGLMEETFFAGCGTHKTHRKNEKNIFCLACCVSFCPHCLPSHRAHPLLQVRRYVYHDVVRLADLQKLIDCSLIQAYTINGAKVIFLKQRPQTSGSGNSSGRAWRAASGSGSGSGSGSATPNLCFTCDRILQLPFHFCSLSCKVDHMVCQGGEGLASMWVSSPSQLDGLRLTYNDNDKDDDDNQEDPFFKRKTKAAASAAAASDTDTDTPAASPSAGPSRTSRLLTVFSLNSRRKQCAPHRAPLS